MVLEYLEILRKRKVQSDEEKPPPTPTQFTTPPPPPPHGVLTPRPPPLTDRTPKTRRTGRVRTPFGRIRWFRTPVFRVRVDCGVLQSVSVAYWWANEHSHHALGNRAAGSG
jgi:hypothetical protein